MDTSDGPDNVNHDRRRFLGAAGAGALAVGAGLTSCTRPHAGESAAPGRAAASRSAAGMPARTSFGPVKQITTGVLSTGYVELGPSHGRPVILMHGFPYDIHSYAEVAPLLAT